MERRSVFWKDRLGDHQYRSYSDLEARKAHLIAVSRLFATKSVASRLRVRGLKFASMAFTVNESHYFKPEGHYALLCLTVRVGAFRPRRL